MDFNPFVQRVIAARAECDRLGALLIEAEKEAECAEKALSSVILDAGRIPQIQPTPLPNHLKFKRHNGQPALPEKILRIMQNCKDISPKELTILTGGKGSAVRMALNYLMERDLVYRISKGRYRLKVSE